MTAFSGCGGGGVVTSYYAVQNLKATMSQTVQTVKRHFILTVISHVLNITDVPVFCAQIAPSRCPMNTKYTFGGGPKFD
jgi:hypothetical protein